MNVERSGRYDTHANVRSMRWAETPGDERRDGIRIGYARGFCWIPDSEAMNLAHELIEFIDANSLNRDTINANTHT